MPAVQEYQGLGFPVGFLLITNEDPVEWVRVIPTLHSVPGQDARHFVAIAGRLDDAAKAARRGKSGVEGETCSRFLASGLL